MSKCTQRETFCLFVSYWQPQTIHLSIPATDFDEEATNIHWIEYNSLNWIHNKVLNFLILTQTQIAINSELLNFWNWQMHNAKMMWIKNFVEIVKLFSWKLFYGQVLLSFAAIMLKIYQKSSFLRRFKHKKKFNPQIN